MAQRRMFHTDVVESDKFLDLSAGAQLLYFHLGMQADDDGFLIGPRGWERVGDVSNVTFTNGAIVDEDGSLYIYYAASDTRLHVASTTVEKMLDYAFNTPVDPLRSRDCVAQRCELIDRNLAYLSE